MRPKKHQGDAAKKRHVLLNITRGVCNGQNEGGYANLEKKTGWGVGGLRKKKGGGVVIGKKRGGDLEEKNNPREGGRKKKNTGGGM